MSGLPVAVAVVLRLSGPIGFDIDKKNMLRVWTGEISPASRRDGSLAITARTEELRGSNVFSVCGPACRPEIHA